MSDLRMLLIAREGEAREAYRAALDRLGVPYDIAASFGEVPALAGGNAYSGLLMDILTLVRTKKEEEKTVAYECINFYPSTRLKWDSKRDRISLLAFDHGTADEAESALETFIEERCRSFPPRALRSSIRKDLVLNLYLSGRSLSAEEKTFSLNVSRGGAFIQTIHSYEKGDDVSIRFRELFEGTEVRGVVCWRLAWGERRAVPGIGIRFEGLSEAQAAELARLLKK
ncbi:PilZ domain-containing protein [Geobacter sp. DSM 9736]|uniref:PilZ domain-containing protein n=1 Tax=Geobacter sp. DSM 9736 TaxID=1277350 RepID=UPI000B510B37|nr:PilZ domain-containing protein [Geobacter sp. DSM 9736]SNB44978.1 PilZ domain-containing protein [Geobacter sp. DSM 9736]